MTHNKISGELFASMVCGGAALLRAHSNEINDLNVFPIPDGDTGDNMSMTIEAGVSAVKGYGEQAISAVSSKLAEGMLLGARGNSGVILSQLFAGMARAFEGQDECDVSALSRALREGVKQAYGAVLKPTEGTILTVAREAQQYAAEHICPESTAESYFSDYMAEMKRSLEHTPELLPCLKEAGVVDSGGAGYVYVIEGMKRVLSGERVERTEQIRTSGTADIDFSSFNENSIMKYGYCTELLLQLQNSKTDVYSFETCEITDYLSTIGDSIVAFKVGTVVKLHVHTMTPDKVLSWCRQFGEFLTVKIENMTLQHSDSVFVGKEDGYARQKPKQEKKLAVIAVANGEGLCETMRQLGADEIVEGGQTMNPSSEDFLAAIERTCAKSVIIMPNNGNVILAAQQAAKLYRGADVRVLPTKTVGDGYSALSMLDPDGGTLDEIMEQLTDAMTGVVTGMVSRAVRPAKMNGLTVKKGDYIGFCGKEILCAEKTPEAAVQALAAKIDMSDSCVMIGICGKELTDRQGHDINRSLCDTYPTMEFYGIDGGQDIYCYILVVQ